MKEKLAATTDAKKQAKIQDMLSKNEAIHKAVVEDMEPSPGLPLSQGDRLKAAYHKQRELEKIESKSAQTIEEMRRLQNELPAVNEEIETLQQMSQEIFETDTELDKRVRALKATLGGSKKKKAPASSVFGTSAASGGGSGWSTAGAKKGGSGSRTTGGAKKSGGGNAFAALSLG
ncbi:hypothetical protein SARC_13827 [Sphaeroforma arctica JP610]|uniref:Uncharacterized protein n=1 Tax=Sphaeroforma arctica JP610 TaxID=667725 RepID=A0A0L0FA89_9EUKA|nr:hypothetical protein SARC_13827 [Sphaeroforma arctica JP610]KNC73612.1 hypothetical protein SARC_13827 [Sphaeroforma arctica JP610]|eukprot:XP_014147514.1 hypothetical protein SARC_13827 [Sphaeroforma arctica JP610]